MALRRVLDRMIGNELLRDILPNRAGKVSPKLAIARSRKSLGSWGNQLVVLRKGTGTWEVTLVLEDDSEIVFDSDELSDGDITKLTFKDLFMTNTSQAGLVNPSFYAGHRALTEDYFRFYQAYTPAYSPPVTEVEITGHTDDAFIQGFSSVDYATARSTSSAHQTSSTTCIVGQWYLTAMGYCVQRGFLLFDTSSIPEAAVIDEVKLTMYLSGNPVTNNFDVRIHKYNWDNPITVANREANYDGALNDGIFDQVFANSDDLVFGWYTSPALDVSWINKSGYTKYVLLSSRDVNNQAPGPDETDQATFYLKENAPDDPYLTIKYY